MSDPPIRTRKASLAVGRGPRSFDAETRSCVGVLATENPVAVRDPRTGAIVSEVLLVSGARAASKVPLLNAHRRDEAAAVLGSVEDIHAEGGELVGRVTFASTAGDAAKLVEEGHLAGLSVGYTVDKTRYIPKGKSVTVGGRSYTGPLNLVEEWTVKEVSVTPIGADPSAKFRSLGKDSVMSHEVSNSNDSDNVIIGAPANLAETSRSEINAYIRGACEAINQRHAAHGIISEQLPTMQAAKERIDDLRAAVQHERAARQERLPHTFNARSDRIDAIGSRDDKAYGAMRDALCVRTLGACMTDEQVEKHHPENKRTAGWQDLRGASLLRLAEFCLEDSGIRTRGMSAPEIAMAVFGDIRERGAWHVSAMFSNLLRDATNKSLLSAYREAPVTYRRIFTRGDSPNDFKAIHRVRLSETPNLPVWTDNVPPEQTALVDERESYALEAYSRQVSFSWRLLINDDLSAFSRIPADLGRAAARTENALAWSVLTSNPTLQDGQALISAATGNRKKANTSTGAITVANVGAARAIMRLQVGVNTKGGNASEAVLNLSPRYLVVPAALETVAEQVINSTHDPVANAPSGVFNPFSGLGLVCEPLLDATSAAQWYIFTSPDQATVIEYCHLAGQEGPTVRDWTDDATLAKHYAVVTTFGAKAIDFRGVVRSTGS